MTKKDRHSNKVTASEKDRETVRELKMVVLHRENKIHSKKLRERQV
jgi:hypothetical protein